MMKIKKNNKNFSLSLYHLLVIAIIFCGVLLFVLKPIKASADNDTILYSGGDWTRNDNVNGWIGSDYSYYKSFSVSDTCSNPILIYNNNSKNSSVATSSIYVSKDNVNLTGVHSEQITLSSTGYNSGYYLLETGGDYKIGFHNTGGNWNSFNYDIFCNVDPDDPVYYSLTAFVANSFTIPPTNSGNSGNIWYIGGSNVDSDLATTTYTFASGWERNYWSYYDLASNFTNTFYLTNALVDEFSYFVFSIYNLNYKEPGSSSAFINYDFSFIPKYNLNFDLSKQNTLTYHYNFCDNYENIKSVKFGLEDPSISWFPFSNFYTDIILDKEFFTSPQMCMGTKTVSIDMSSFPYSQYSGGVFNSLFLREFVVDYWDSEPLIFDDYSYPPYSVSTGDNDSFYITIEEITVDTTNTNTIISVPFSYDFCDNENFVASTTKLYLNLEGQFPSGAFANTSLGQGITVDSCSGESSFEYEIFSNSSYNGLLSIYWLPSSPSSPAVWTSNKVSFTASFVDTSFDTGLDDFVPSAFNPFSSFLNRGKDTIKNTFPFGLLSSIAKSWEDSKNASSSISFFSFIDNEGNIKFTPSSKLTGNASTSIVLFGPAIFNNADLGIGPIFAEIRNISTYLLWGLFFFLLYKFARNFYIELSENK